jgi:hypothetical protein
MQETLEQIREDFFTYWVDSHGLGLLERQGTTNDNGILFLVYFLILCRKLDKEGKYYHEDKQRFIAAVTLLIVVRDGGYVKGLFNRRPNDPTPEAHDNYTAITTGARIFDCREIIDDICDYADRNGGIFDNDGSGFSFNQMRQGSEIAYYRVLANRIPSALDLIWLAGGLIFNALFGNYSSKNLGLLRTIGLNYSLPKSKLPDVYALPLLLSVMLWDLIILSKGGIKKNFENYFLPTHPIRRLILLIEKENK